MFRHRDKWRGEQAIAGKRRNSPVLVTWPRRPRSARWGAAACGGGGGGGASGARSSAPSCAPSSTSSACSGTRFWSGAPWGTGRALSLSAGDGWGTCWSGTPSPAPAFGIACTTFFGVSSHRLRSLRLQVHERREKNFSYTHGLHPHLYNTDNPQLCAPNHILLDRFPNIGPLISC